MMFALIFKIHSNDVEDRCILIVKKLFSQLRKSLNVNKKYDLLFLNSLVYRKLFMCHCMFQSLDHMKRLYVKNKKNQKSCQQPFC